MRSATCSKRLDGDPEVIRALDTSVIVAAFASWHADHELARSTLADEPAPVPIGHALIETYSVLTRLPEPQRAEPQHVTEFLLRNFCVVPLVLDAIAQRALPQRLAGLGISGGASYDGLIALTAHDNNAVLVTLDQRATATYARCGVEFELLTSAVG